MRALQAGLDFDFLRFFSLPGASDFASDNWQLNGGSDVSVCGGEAMEDSGLSVDVVDISEAGEETIDKKLPPGLADGPATDWQSSSKRFAVSCFTCTLLAIDTAGGGGGGGGGTALTFNAGALFCKIGADVTTTWPPLVGMVSATVTMPAEAAAACSASPAPSHAACSSARGGV